MWPETAEVVLGCQDPRLTKAQCVEFLRDIGVVVSALDALIDVPRENQQVLRLVFKSQKDHQDFLEVHEGNHKRKVNGVLQDVLVNDRSLNWKFVRFANLPTKFDLGLVKTRLSCFGRIKNINWEVYSDKSIPELEKVKTGWLKAEMVIDTDIPSYIDIGPHRVFVSYHGQRKTCRICDSVDHMAESCPPGRRVVAGKSNDASTAPKVADNATGQKETTSVSNDKNKTRDAPNPANPAKRGRTEAPIPEPKRPEEITPPQISPGSNEDHVTPRHSQPMTVDPPDANPDPGSNLGGSEMDLTEDVGVSDASSAEIPASQVPPSESVSHVSETQQSLGITDSSWSTVTNKKPEKPKPGPKKDSRVPQLTLTKLTRSRSGSNISK